MLERKPGQPVGIALGVEPRWSRFDRGTGYRADGYAVEFKFLMDAVLTDRLFGAFNLNYALGTQRFNIPNASGSAARPPMCPAPSRRKFMQPRSNPSREFSSVSKLHHRAVFSGLALDRKVGEAVNVGPTFAILFPGERIINIAWTPQVWGRARPASAPGSFDLDNFERNEFRIKFGTPLTAGP